MPQIVTLTVNPTVDITWDVEDVVPTRKLRSSGGSVYPGGGGINVSHVIATLGGESTAIFPRGGITGTLMTELLDDYAIDRRVVGIGGHTRLAATIYERSTEDEYRVIPPGPDMAETEWQAMLDLVTEIKCEYLVCSGSLARGVPDDFYARVARIATERGIKMILDTSGRPLVEALKAGVYLVKPNLRELEHLMGHKAPTPEKQEQLAREVIEEGRAEIVALTLGAEGALLVWKDGSKRYRSPDVERRSATGAGSSFVAGLTLGLAEGRPLEDAFALAVACGTASLVTPGTEMCRKADVERLYAEVKA
ncbi:MAG: 1-phosphofructokinase family hexose kinase [Rhodospirillales bacterium]|nr:1-phosphofructokinase family hexose kinase [Rhodospirillales bacterium]